jgi:catechol 2,3-dioxygenase-like lactoylglutathione lyase family enzyme
VRDPDGELFQLVSTGAGSLGARGRRWWPSMPHLVLTVSDLDRSVCFYRDVLGLLVEGETEVEGGPAVGMLDPSQPPVAIFLRDPDGQLIELLPL